jgi:hypothetical protein
MFTKKHEYAYSHDNITNMNFDLTSVLAWVFTKFVLVFDLIVELQVM